MKNLLSLIKDGLNVFAGLAVIVVAVLAVVLLARLFVLGVVWIWSL